MSTAPLRALVIGAGRVGAGYDEDRRGRAPLTHAGAWSGCSSVEFVGAVDPDADVRDRFTHRWARPAYTDLAQALHEHKPELISLCTPPSGRLDQLREIVAADGGDLRAVWVEKPLAVTSDEGLAIRDLADRAGLAVQLNFHRRFDPLHRAIAQTLKGRGEVPLHIDMRFSGTLLNFGSHAFDIFRWWAGDPAAVGALQLTDGDPMVVLEGPAPGVSGTLKQVATEGTTVFDLDAITPRHRIEVRSVGEEARTLQAAPAVEFSGVTTHRPHAYRADGIGPAFATAAAELARHVNTGTPLACGVDDGIAALRLHERVVAELAERS